MVIARIWRTEVREGREAEYECFARDRSLPMFRTQHGYLGCLMWSSGSERFVLTAWNAPEDVERLSRSPNYLETVRAILASGMLGDDQSVEVFEMHAFDLAAGRLG